MSKSPRRGEWGLSARQLYVAIGNALRGILMDTAIKRAFTNAGYRSAHERLRDIAIAALARHPRTLEGARTAILAQVTTDAGLLWELFERWQRPALDLLIQSVAAELREQRASAEKSGLGAKTSTKTNVASPPRAGTAGPTSADREAARADVVRVLSKLDTFLINRCPIGDCTPEQALAWADSQSTQARYARMLASNLPPGRPIRQSITPAEANALWARVVKEAG
jgi:hypothetical protein